MSNHITAGTGTVQPKVELRQATESDLPALIALQYQCFSHSVLVEQIASPDTPEGQAAAVELRRSHMREDAGLQTVKAVLLDDDDDSTETETRDETIVGFCMFYVPVVSPSDPDTVDLPTKLRSESTIAAMTAKASTSTSSNDVTAPTINPHAAIPPFHIPDSTTADPSNLDSDPNSTTSTTSTADSGSVLNISFAQTNLPSLRQNRYDTVARLLPSTRTNRTRGAGYVAFLSIDPRYRRLGLGRKLMEYGCDLFDRIGVAAYLEATADAVRLYRSLGFEQVGEQALTVDGKVRARYPCMWRKARGAEQ